MNRMLTLRQMAVALKVHEVAVYVTKAMPDILDFLDASESFEDPAMKNGAVALRKLLEAHAAIVGAADADELISAAEEFRVERAGRDG